MSEKQDKKQDLNMCFEWLVHGDLALLTSNLGISKKKMHRFKRGEIEDIRIEKAVRELAKLRQQQHDEKMKTIIQQAKNED